MTTRMMTAHALRIALLATTACGQGEATRERTQTAAEPLLGPTETTKSGAVALLRGNNSNLVLLEDTCSAALIAPNLALTARHCVEILTSSYTCSATFTGLPTHGYFAIRTEADVSGTGTPFVVSKIRKPTTIAACDGDIALLILETSVPGTTLVPIVPRLAAPPMSGAIYSAIGYGANSDGVNSNDGRRRRADGSQVACGGDCGGAPFMFYGAPSTICGGDSGGPALDAQGGVIGIAARGSCGTAGGIDMYTRTDAHAALIVAAALEAATLGGYPAPAWAVVPPSKDAGAADAAADADAGAHAGAATPHGADTPAQGASEDSPAPASATREQITKTGCSVVRAVEPTTAWPLLLLASALVALRERRRRICNDENGRRAGWPADSSAASPQMGYSSSTTNALTALTGTSAVSFHVAAGTLEPEPNESRSSIPA